MVMGIRPSWFYDLLIKISPEDIPGSLAHIEKVFKEVSPAFPFWYQFLDDWKETTCQFIFLLGYVVEYYIIRHYIDATIFL